jgi:hypothetical protein
MKRVPSISENDAKCGKDLTLKSGKMRGYEFIQIKYTCCFGQY